MVGRFAWLPLTLVGLLLAAAPAGAAVTIGSTTGTPILATAPGAVYVETVDPSAVSYAVPVGGGVITSVSMVGHNFANGAPSGKVRVFAMRKSGSTFSVVGGATVALGVADKSTTQQVSATAHIPVAAGDRLGVYSVENASVDAYTAAGATVPYGNASTTPADGATVSLGAGTFGNAALLVSATIEPDADLDGYGDETQDTCPGNALIHAGVCPIDLQTTIGATPGSVTVGDVSTVIATVTNAGTVPAAGATATLTVPDGLQLIAASTTGGECSGVTCALGDLPPGQSRKVYLVVRGVGVGAPPVSVTAHSTIVEVDTSNDTATATITVTAPPVIAGNPPATVPPVIKLCTVPSLKGKTATAAKTALTLAGCAAGAIKGSKSKSAKVSSQLIAAKVHVIAGTKIGFTLKAPKKARKK